MSNKKQEAVQTISTLALWEHFKGASNCISLDYEFFDMKGKEHGVNRNLKSGDLFFHISGKDYRVYDAATRNFATILEIELAKFPPTFEEVRKHFKGAEQIVCLIGKKKVEVNQFHIQNYIYFRENSYFINNVMVWNKESGFATFYGGHDDEEVQHRQIVDDKGNIVFMYIGTKPRMIEVHQEVLKAQEAEKMIREKGIAALAKEARGIKNSRIERIRFPGINPGSKAEESLKNWFEKRFNAKLTAQNLFMVNHLKRIKSESKAEQKPVEQIEVKDPVEVNAENTILKAIMKQHFKIMDQQRIHPGPKEIVEVPSGIHTVQEVTNSSFIGFQSGKDKYYAVETNNYFSLTKPYQLKLCAVMFRKRSLRELASTMIKSNYKAYSFTNKEELILWLKN